MRVKRKEGRSDGVGAEEEGKSRADRQLMPNEKWEIDQLFKCVLGSWEEGEQHCRDLCLFVT